ncbi:MAG: diguanylate cyclase [Pirellulales bacterium]|nr:diguanylate cyclase [Pirellulales bacterium]
MFQGSADDLDGVNRQLQQAIYNHQEWSRAIHRTLVCELPCDQRDIGEDAHRQCLFGQWYYGDSNRALREHPGFEPIGQEHALMHQLARELLLASAAGESVSAIDYDRFSNSLERLKLQVTTLQRELQESTFNLDPLTGAKNRLGMLTCLREQHALVKRRAHQCCISMMDLDHFKVVNDLHGHQAGDQVLRSVAQFALNSLRPYDAIFRYGGEEFLLNLPQANLEAALPIIERLREGIASLPIACAGGRVLQVTASFGIAQLEPECCVEETLLRADTALYEAKANGRNRVQCWAAATSDRRLQLTT